MGRLAVVSNRTPDLEGKANTGGLVTALKTALDERGGIWFGWSGRTSRSADPESAGEVQVARCGAFDLATIDLTEAELDGYYNRLANRTLWPVFHGRLDLASIDKDAYETYRKVNRRFAAALHPLLDGSETVWVQDYHLIPLGSEMRRLGVKSPMGFFLHIPFPDPGTFVALPWARALAQALAAYDLVGFQTRTCAENFLAYLDRYGPGTVHSDGWIHPRGRLVRVEAHPIGIDTERFAGLAASEEVAARVRRIRHRMPDGGLIASVERLDYSKGIPQHFRALELLLDHHPEYRERTMLYQVAAPSRLSVPEYRDIKSELEALSGQINAQIGTLDWVPIRYLNQPVNHASVAALLRACSVGLVTPLRDGMNLVAKEYVAAQDPADPGVLVLSSFAGAAEELTDALMVNPYDTEAMAETLAQALEMPLAERRRRWQAMMDHLLTHDVHNWQQSFLESLGSVQAQRGRKLAATMRKRPLQQASEAMRNGGLPKEEARRAPVAEPSGTANTRDGKPTRWDA